MSCQDKLRRLECRAARFFHLPPPDRKARGGRVPAQGLAHGLPEGVGFQGIRFDFVSGGFAFGCSVFWHLCLGTLTAVELALLVCFFVSKKTDEQPEACHSADGMGEMPKDGAKRLKDQAGNPAHKSRQRPRALHHSTRKIGRSRPADAMCAGSCRSTLATPRIQHQASMSPHLAAGHRDRLPKRRHARPSVSNL